MVVGSLESAHPRFFLFPFIKHAVLNGQTAHTKGCLENRCASRSNHRSRAANGVFKTDVLRESKKSARCPGDEIDDRVWLLSVIVRVLQGRVQLGKGENRSKATYPHSKDEDNNHHQHTSLSTSRRVEVKSTSCGPPPIVDSVWMQCTWQL